MADDSKSVFIHTVEKVRDDNPAKYEIYTEEFFSKWFNVSSYLDIDPKCTSKKLTYSLCYDIYCDDKMPPNKEMLSLQDNILFIDKSNKTLPTTFFLGASNGKEIAVRSILAEVHCGCSQIRSADWKKTCYSTCSEEEIFAENLNDTVISEPTVSNFTAECGVELYTQVCATASDKVRFCQYEVM